VAIGGRLVKGPPGPLAGGTRSGIDCSSQCGYALLCKLAVAAPRLARAFSAFHNALRKACGPHPHINDNELQMRNQDGQKLVRRRTESSDYQWRLYSRRLGARVCLAFQHGPAARDDIDRLSATCSQLNFRDYLSCSKWNKRILDSLSPPQSVRHCKRSSAAPSSIKWVPGSRSTFRQRLIPVSEGGFDGRRFGHPIDCNPDVRLSHRYSPHGAQKASSRAPKRPTITEKAAQ